MIVEQRTYSLVAGKVGEYLKIYEADGLEIQSRILGRMVGYFTTETGVLNQLIQMWAYDDLADRAARRAVLLADEGFKAYLAKVFPLILKQETVILNPTAFSPIR